MTQLPKKGEEPSNEGTTPPENTPLPRELIVIASQDVGLRASEMGVSSVTGRDVSQLGLMLKSEGFAMHPLFGESEEQIQEEVASMERETGEKLPDLSVYYQIEAPEEKLDELAARLLQIDGIEAAYIKPPAELASIESGGIAPAAEGVEPAPYEVISRPHFNDMAPDILDAPAHTPDFSAQQIFLTQATTGIDAHYAWTQPGGRGQNVRIVDIEWGWRTSHEDLTNFTVTGTNSTALNFENHGTAVVGELIGVRNAFGVTGICPDAQVSAVSLVSNGTAAAIRTAADRLRPGDIILLEVHRAGPRASMGSGQFGFIAIEWWPDDFAAIRYAVTKGVLVVEPAGNGGQNLDDPVYNTRPVGFPASWQNPFNPANPSSGAVVVGAGLPPAGTHGNNAHPAWGDVYQDRGRCFFSNYGARVDAQGWGYEVTTTGYGDLQGGADRNKWYTNGFSGTSSSAPIVAGALGCVQGILRARNRIPLSPARAIQLLRATGSPQQNAPGFTFIPNMSGSGYPQNHPARPRTQRIGNRPNLRQLIQLALETSNWVGVQFTGTLQANQTRRWFTFRWPAHWHVVWTVVPTTPQSGAPQIEWKVQVERASDQHITYWISITNLTAAPINIEARYAVLGW